MASTSSDTNINITLCSPRPSSGLDPNSPVIVNSSIPTRSEIPPNHVLIKVDKFGFSANNVTYQALGEHPHFRYFDFHSAPTSQDGSCFSRTHGLIPVWGFGTILKSTHPNIKDGERIYGYLAPTRYLLLPVSPNDVNKVAFYVPRPHLPPDRRPYNQILRCASDPQYTPTSEAEDLTMLYRPLFWTSYWFEDWLNASSYRGGVHTVLISSASSKTAFCLAYVIGKRIKGREVDAQMRIVGLTSNKNLKFTEGLGLYHDVVTYDAFTTSTPFGKTQSQRWIYIDLAGNELLNNRIYAYFASPYSAELVAAISLGVTNLVPGSKEGSSMQWTTQKPSDTASSSSNAATSRTKSPFPPKAEQFFMPEWLSVRKNQIPVNTILARQNEAWKELMRDCPGWVELERVYGADNVLDAYKKLVKEGMGPEKGLIWSLWDQEGKEGQPNARARL